MEHLFLMFLNHTQRRTTVGRTPLDEWSARRRDLYLTTHDTHNGQISMPPVGFEPTISAGERPQTYALDRAATGTGIYIYIHIYIYIYIYIYKHVCTHDVSYLREHYSWYFQNFVMVQETKTVTCYWAAARNVYIFLHKLFKISHHYKN